METNKEKWYCASYSHIGDDGYDICPDGDYFIADNGEEAIAYAKQKASEGTDYADIGHVDLDLVSVSRVDPEHEWEEAETIWY